MAYSGKWDIEIMAGGGVNAGNIEKVAQEIRPTAIHFSGTIKKEPENPSLFSDQLLVYDTKKA